MPRRIFKSILKALPGSDAPGAAGAGISPGRELQIATCALLLEIAHADNEFTPEEERKISRLMRDHFALTDEAFREIHKLSEKKRTDSIDLWHFTKTIKEQYSALEKEKIIEMLWAVIYTDGELDAHEDYLVHKLATLLDISHRKLIDAKIKILRQKKAT